MKECINWQISIENYLAGEISEADQAALDSHRASCADCRELLDAHDNLFGASESAPEPTEQEMSAMRLGVMAQVSQLEPARERLSFWQDLLLLLRGHPWATAPMAAMVLVAVLFLGRWSAQGVATGEPQLLQQIMAQAALQQGVEDYNDNSLIYSNVSVQPQADGTLAMNFDVSRHVSMQTPLDSPLAKDVVVAAILNPTRMGSRVQAVQITSEINDNRFRDALVIALNSDPSLSVRLEALKALIKYPFDETIKSALLTTLEREHAVQLRLTALEHLLNQQVDPQLIQEVINQIPLEGDAAVSQHALQLQKTL